MKSRHSLKAACSAAMLMAFAAPAAAQELNCRVEVNYEAVSTTQKDLLDTFQEDVSRYLNNFRWGDETLDQKIECTISIFFLNTSGENRYAAQAFVGSQRSVFGTQRSTALVRLKDDAWEFTYLKTTPLDHNLQQFNELTSFLDYYAYLITGYDYDTYERSGGNPYFRKASDVVGLGRSMGAKGWDLKSGSYSRGQLIDEILSPAFAPVRLALYTYHFAGLDSLKPNPQRARANILAALEGIGKTRKKADPRNLFMRFFFEAKYQEIVEVFRRYPDPSVYLRLGDIDPVHRAEYEEAMRKLN